MRFLERFSRSRFSLTCTEAFSDAGFAVIVTLLVLELKMLHLHAPTSVGELFDLTAQQDAHAVIKGFIGPASYRVGAGLAWVNIYAAFVVTALTPLFYITPWQERGAARAKSKRTP
jgi:hypothetical protein